MIGSCIVQSIFQLRHRENGISDSKTVLMRLEHTAMIAKYSSQVTRVGHGSNYYHTTIYSEIVCHLAEHDDPQNSAKNHENV